MCAHVATIGSARQALQLWKYLSMIGKGFHLSAKYRSYLLFMPYKRYLYNRVVQILTPVKIDMFVSRIDPILDFSLETNFRLVRYNDFFLEMGARNFLSDKKNYRFSNFS